MALRKTAPAADGGLALGRPAGPDGPGGSREVHSGAGSSPGAGGLPDGPPWGGGPHFRRGLLKNHRGEHFMDVLSCDFFLEKMAKIGGKK